MVYVSLSLIAFLTCLVTPMLFLRALIKKNVLYPRYILLGVGVYLLLHVLLYPIAYTIAPLQEQLYLKLVYDVTYFALIGLLIKIFLYTRTVIKMDVIENIGYGEAFAETLLLLLPNLLSLFIWYFTFYFGNVEQFYAGTLSSAQIQETAEVYQNISFFYLIYMILLILSLFLFQTYIAKHIQHSFMRLLCISLLFYFNYIVLPLVNYGFGCLFFIVCLGWYVYQRVYQRGQERRKTT